MVFDGGESESISHFSKFVNSRITLWDVNLVNNVSLSTRSNPFLLQNRVKRGSWSQRVTSREVFFNCIQIYFYCIRWKLSMKSKVQGG
jgi:hypothetical protein